MLSLKQKQSGFTIVELLIVIVIIGILAGLVITTFVGIQARGRDSERQTDINAIQKQLEAYYANVGAYPTLANITSSTWREGNNFKLDPKALQDPTGKTDIAGNVASSTNKTTYGYVTTASCGQATNDSGVAQNPTTPCSTYTVSAWMEAKNEIYSQTNQ